ncbi:esterase FUS5-like [Solanum pennellii]|uniref:Esterase FUS5-like n=1 Tax=Solanum pennellii TaxID=28526 RepID=A0ABM1UZC9_SOLPN|nr:esterase FUS5-like [Solanum pennellii]
MSRFNISCTDSRELIVLTFSITKHGVLNAEKEESKKKKPRILCLHGYGGSGEIFKKVIFRWPESITGKLDLVFLDGTFPAQAGKSTREGFFDPPYFVWFQSNKDFKECLEYIEDFMLKHGPFDGVLGFSQVIIFC